MEIFYTKRAARQLEDLPKPIQKRIAKKMRFFGEQKNPLRFAERLTDYREGEFRFRVGDYRLTFDVKNTAIYVLHIGRRDNIYQ
ncbi:hypothetical protein A2647_02965 [Candidatus Nomurabacteria bacterium RIFCSPHIGHO2_01_FULL_40_24b]|uniref:Plasmid stabilization protein n=1 Tax=Candidatus Nomurabacteria bacterium RIFCSPHIGHO2_01_FULL_40_24b TaxID=1801739 RepID=A0A1F6V5I2_9BACT|nr:MAG: hypothetical protein A2647_02965 [Candidatus Nomurabacteria bacterium RIFCSPHIGHO2_01_FULL_40_24b]